MKLMKLLMISRNYLHARRLVPEPLYIRNLQWHLRHKSTNIRYNDRRFIHETLQKLYVSPRIPWKMLRENSWWSMRRISRP